MICPFCESPLGSRIADSRKRNKTTWRRRVCFACDSRWNTIEVVTEQTEARNRKRCNVKGLKNWQVVRAEFIDYQFDGYLKNKSQSNDAIHFSVAKSGPALLEWVEKTFQVVIASHRIFTDIDGNWCCQVTGEVRDDRQQT